MADTTKTIAKDGTPSDYSSLSAAVAAECDGKTLTGNLTLEFIDATPQIYDEIVTVENCTIPDPYWLTILGKFSRGGRTTMSNATAGFLLTLKSNRIWVKGIKFDRTEDLDDTRSGIYLEPHITDIRISHCQFLGNGYYKQYGVKTGFNSVNIRVEIWNNLIKNWGFSGLYLIPGFNARSFKIWNNTFIKNQEALTLRSNDSSAFEVWNNIFDMDSAYLKECIYFSAIYGQKDGGLIEHHLRQDYNLYNFRTTTDTYLYVTEFSPPTNAYADLAALQAAFPALEVNGVEGDPLFDVYCQDYHISNPDSPAYAADAATIPVDDNDGVTRGAPHVMGCYGGVEYPENVIAAPQIDLLQNDTFWVEIEDTRSSGDDRNVQVELEYLRLL